MIQIILVIVAFSLFVISTILNRRVEVPKDVELPEKCEGCSIENCFRKRNILTDEVKENIKEECLKEDENER